MFVAAWMWLAPAMVATEPRRILFWQDTLRADLTSQPSTDRENRGGEFTAAGWRMTATKGFLRLTPAAALPREGELEVVVTNLDWSAVARAVGTDKKIHFLNAFSNANGDHHAEAGGTGDDALWTLRLGTDARGGPRYGDGFKVLWASRGAKRMPGSDYHEQTITPPGGWRWRPDAMYRFAVSWSARLRTLTVKVNGAELGRLPWLHDGAPLRHIFLGGAADFNALSGAIFSDLRVYELGW